MHQKGERSKKAVTKKAVTKKIVTKKTAAKKAAVKKNVMAKKSAASARKPGFSVNNVVFKSGGLNCDGRLYLPAGVKKPPVIIMAHGFGGEMAFGIPAYAEEFARNGYAVLIFDYRYYGASEGEPRHLISFKKQLGDWESAIDFAKTLDRVDGNRICISGFSFSGGHVLVTAALNSNVKAFLSHVPFMDSMFLVKISGMKKVLKINAAAYKDIFNSMTGRAPHNIAIVGRPDEFAILNTPECYDGYMSIIPENSEWKNEMPARSMLSASFYRPFKYIPEIKCRGLVVENEYDSLVDNKMVERFFGNNPQFELLRLRCGHFGLYKGEYFKKTLAAELRFLKSIFS